MASGPTPPRPIQLSCSAHALIHPIFARTADGEGRSARWNVPVHLAIPTVPWTTDARGPPGFLERLRGMHFRPAAAALRTPGVSVGWKT